MRSPPVPAIPESATVLDAQLVAMAAKLSEAGVKNMDPLRINARGRNIFGFVQGTRRGSDPGVFYVVCVHVHYDATITIEVKRWKEGGTVVNGRLWPAAILAEMTTRDLAEALAWR